MGKIAQNKPRIIICHRPSTEPLSAGVISTKNRMVKTGDSPILPPVREKSPILPAIQKMTLEKTTGYAYGHLRRKRPKPETGHVGLSNPTFGPKNINGPNLPRRSLALQS